MLSIRGLDREAFEVSGVAGDAVSNKVVGNGGNSLCFCQSAEIEFVDVSSIDEKPACVS